MDEELFKKGLEKRKATLGKEYVEKNLEQADEFTLPFQKAMTEWCWGFGWGDEVIDMKTRSMMNLAMIGALGKMHEWEIHCRGAITNGVQKDEIRAIIHVIGIYCGVPQALECFRVAKKYWKKKSLMKALVFTDKEQLEYQSMPSPTPKGEELLVKVSAAEYVVRICTHIMVLMIEEFLH